MRKKDILLEPCYALMEFEKRYLPASIVKKTAEKHMTAVDLGTKLAEESIQKVRKKLVAEQTDAAQLIGRPIYSALSKVPHHGSASSSCLEFLAVVDPQLAVISVGVGNPFGHPNPGVVERLVELVGEDSLYLTSEHGTIELITDGERLWVEVEK